MSAIVPSAQELIDSDKSVREYFAIQVLQAADGECRLSANVQQGWLNGAGFVHGSVAYALMDSASAYACASKGVRGLTINGTVTYVRGSQAEEELFATAKVLSQSRRVMSLSAEVANAQGQLLAHGSFLFQLRVE
ncbi:MAG: hotdog fold thioesterase [Proteobacteria bacterium]|nr:hotdog fold thioesterase [Pseudomonadota bacterium]